MKSESEFRFGVKEKVTRNEEKKGPRGQGFEAGMKKK
jgi:hypothetical protein